MINTSLELSQLSQKRPKAPQPSVEGAEEKGWWAVLEVMAVMFRSSTTLEGRRAGVSSPARNYCFRNNIYRLHYELY